MLKEKMESLWRMLLGMLRSNGGFVALPDEETPEEEPPKTLEEETPEETPEGVVEIDGVKYTRDAEGNYLIGSQPVLDSDRVPFYNRSKEVDRVKSESEEKILKMQREHQVEIDKLKNPPPPALGDDDMDEVTGLTGRQLRALDSRNEAVREKAFQELGTRTLALIADTQIRQQKFQLAQNPKYKSFFANKNYARELDTHLAGLSLKSAVLPNIVEQAVKLVIGNHYDEMEKEAEKRGRKVANEKREIVGEIELGASAGASKGEKVVVTEEIREFAKDSGLSLEAAAEVVTYRKKIREQREKGGK